MSSISDHVVFEDLDDTETAAWVVREYVLIFHGCSWGIPAEVGVAVTMVAYEGGVDSGGGEE